MMPPVSRLSLGKVRRLLSRAIPFRHDALCRVRRKTSNDWTDVMTLTNFYSDSLWFAICAR
jgi:hypothetical protein